MHSMQAYAMRGEQNQHSIANDTYTSTTENPQNV